MFTIHGAKTMNVFDHVSVLNSQSVLRNDVTSYALAQSLSLRFVLSRVFFIILAPGAKIIKRNTKLDSKQTSNVPC